MDELSYPDDALDYLKRMRYAANATRTMEMLSTSFAWSDEGLSRANRLCLNHGSRAVFFTMVFRTSLIKGQPIEEYRPAWDQLREACPDWPGFRPERCRPELLPSWERELKRQCIQFERSIRDLERQQTAAD